MALRRNISSLYSKIRRPPVPSELGRRPIFHSAATGVPASVQLQLQAGKQLMEAIRGLNDGYNYQLHHERVHLNVLLPKAPLAVAVASPEENRLQVSAGGGWRMSVKEAKKLLKASRMESIRAALRRVPATAIPYSEFLAICRHEPATARALDESGSVIVVGDVVFPRPDEVVRAIEKVVRDGPAKHQPTAATEELEVLTEKKAAIDEAAEAGVWREMWGGIAFLAAQTAAFMRLTFWELSWDVMEPICFFVTSSYFIAGYAFFLRTSREPSFEGFFAGRFAAKQQRLMAKRGFDLRRFNELLSSTPAAAPTSSSGS